MPISTPQIGRRTSHAEGADVHEHSLATADQRADPVQDEADAGHRPEPPKALSHGPASRFAPAIQSPMTISATDSTAYAPVAGAK